ncbi:MAG TPA: hypothetical protein VMV06_08770 [Acidimicrobiales bacterium]|nr:hypothetical protein [Acidimicrobiales bacterium]
MARSHNPGAQVVVPGLALAAPPAFESHPTVHTVHTVQVRGAEAPEGGNR